MSQRAIETGANPVLPRNCKRWYSWVRSVVFWVLLKPLNVG